MKNRRPLSLATLNALRQNAVATWLREETLDGPEGWSISPVDPYELLRCFPLLRLKENMRLLAYQFREHDSGNGLVRIVPASEQGSGQPSDAALEKEIHAPPPSKILQFVTGDGAVESYAQASILIRELREFGAFGHGVTWLDAHLLDNTVWKNGASSAPPLGDVPAGMNSWNWVREKSQDDFQPYAVQDDTQIQIVFFTFENPVSPVLIRNTDTYTLPGYFPRIQREIIARL